MNETFLERAVWDQNNGEIRDGEIRYLMIRPDALMGMVQRLPNELQTQVLAAFAASIFEHGGRSAQKYRAMGATKTGQLLSVIEVTAPQLGWGCWHFKQVNNALHLTVTNSPFAAGYGTASQPVCAPIAGMLQAVAELVYGQACKAEELSCMAQRHAQCHLRAALQHSSKLFRKNEGK